jgi:mRNA-degrading endonuclease RelE of RelBE toxin-antitoxin system
VTIKTTEVFKKGFKKLLKKDRHLIQTYEQLLQELRKNPALGTQLSDGRYKIRLQNKSNNKGKCGGYRVITYTKIENTLVLVYIYSKNEMESVADKKIDEIIKSYKA